MSDDLFPVFTRFPELKNRIPVFPVQRKITPVQPLKSIASNLWIKRDDLTSTIYGGNKIRKLEFILGEVLKKGKKKIITMGGLGTNHGLATAIFARNLGINCTLILFPQPITGHVLQNLALFHHFGAELVHTSGIPGAAFRFYLWQRWKSPGGYFLYAGGSNPLGTLGYVNAVFELREQVASGEIPEPDYIYCPLGSNGTLAGIALGVELCGMRSKVIGVRVTKHRLGPIPLATAGTVLSLMKKALRLMVVNDSSVPKRNLQTPEILHKFFGGGYGCPTKEGLEAMKILWEKEGIKLDPTYTSKTFAAVLEAVRKGSGRDKIILYWHTFNSVDLSEKVKSFDFSGLPSAFHRYFTEDAEKSDVSI